MRSAYYLLFCCAIRSLLNQTHQQNISTLSYHYYFYTLYIWYHGSFNKLIYIWVVFNKQYLLIGSGLQEFYTVNIHVCRFPSECTPALSPNGEKTYECHTK